MASSKNVWVDLYLDALLGPGLSHEYMAVDDDGSEINTITATYLLDKAIEVDEKAIISSWRRAQVNFIYLRHAARLDRIAFVFLINDSGICLHSM
jgi:hypothetical protein